MKLLILTQVVDQNDSNLGFFHRWIEEFSRQTEKVEVLCLRRGKYHLPENVAVHSLGKDEEKGRITYLLRFFHFIISRRRDYDAVFVHMNSEYLVLGGILWKIFKKKTFLWHTHKSMRLLHRIAEKLVTVIGTASPESYRLNSQKVRVLGHGIDTEAFSPKEKRHDDVFHILTTGRISRIKGLETLLDAVSQMKHAGIRTETIVLGGPLTEDDQKYEKELREKAKKVDITDILHFSGSVSHTGVIPYLQGSDVFVNCSNTGSLDKAALEAMATGLPVFTSNEGLKSTLGAHAKDFMFPKGESAVLAKQLLWFHGLDSHTRSSLAQNLRKIVVEGHGLPALVRKIVALLQ
jgi:glycosyltransferase involved in cell wall biosynthesis